MLEVGDILMIYLTIKFYTKLLQKEKMPLYKYKIID